VVILLLAAKRTVMGEFTASWPILVLGWISVVVMGSAAVRMLMPG